MIEHLIVNWMEWAGALAAVVYLLFSIRQSIWLWFCGIVTSLFYLVVFYREALYADMGLQGYYLFASVYGWAYWIRGGTDKQTSQMTIKRAKIQQWMVWMGWSSLWYVVFLFTLFKLPGHLGISPSELPYLDALTTSLSITATWMLVKKYLENWIVWIFVDAISVGMFVYKALYPTALLFAIYTLFACIGYWKWRQTAQTQAHST